MNIKNIFQKVLHAFHKEINKDDYHEHTTSNEQILDAIIDSVDDGKDVCCRKVFHEIDKIGIKFLIKNKIVLDIVIFNNNDINITTSLNPMFLHTTYNKLSKNQSVKLISNIVDYSKNTSDKVNKIYNDLFDSIKKETNNITKQIKKE